MTPTVASPLLEPAEVVIRLREATLGGILVVAGDAGGWFLEHFARQ